MSGAVDTGREAVECAIATVWKLHGEPADGPDPNAVGLPISILDLVETARALLAERDALIVDNATLRQALQIGGDATTAVRAQRDAALAEAARMREALTFYGDVSKYPSPLTGGMGALWSDCGARARAALGGRADG